MKEDFLFMTCIIRGVSRHNYKKCAIIWQALTSQIRGDKKKKNKKLPLPLSEQPFLLTCGVLIKKGFLDQKR